MYMGGIDDFAPKLDLTGFLVYVLIFAVFFLVQHFFLHMIMRVMYEGYNKLPSREMHEYRM